MGGTLGVGWNHLLLPSLLLLFLFLLLFVSSSSSASSSLLIFFLLIILYCHMVILSYHDSVLFFFKNISIHEFLCCLSVFCGYFVGFWLICCRLSVDVFVGLGPYLDHVWLSRMSFGII